MRVTPPTDTPERSVVASRSNHALPATWVNGEWQLPTAPHVSARDRGFTLADGVFETMRVYDGAVFRLDRHLARLEHALAVLDIPARPELRDWVLDAVHQVGGGYLGVRLTVTRGSDAGGVAPPAEPTPTVVVAVNPLPEFPAAVYDVGLTAHLASGRRNERSMTAGLKTLAYTDAVAAWIEARRAGADEALFLDTEGHCAEATSSNLFVWTGSTLVTPPITCGVLPGITREAVLELAGAIGLSSAERVLELPELLGAEEAFLTSTLRGLAPLVRVGGHPIGLGTPGARTRRLAEAYEALLVRECRA